VRKQFCFLPIGHWIERSERPLEAGDGFRVRRAAGGLDAGLMPVGRRLGPELAAQRVASQHLHLLGQPGRVKALDAQDDGAMQSAAPILHEAAVGHVVRQRVLERVLLVREQRRLVDQLRGLEVRQAEPERCLGRVGDGLQEGPGEVLADDGGGLQRPVVRAG
jgi:hypothetical protein